MFRKSRKEYPDFFVSQKIQIAKSPIHGHGVFAAERIEAHELIEASPVILFHWDTHTALKDYFGSRHVLMDYPFSWNGKIVAFALGFAGLYNHSADSPNATWKLNYQIESIDFYSKHAIEAGEEICTRYLMKHLCDSVWFDDPETEAIPMHAGD